MQWPRGAIQRLLQMTIGRGIIVVAIDELELRGQFRESRFIDPAIVLQAVARALAQPIQGPAGTRHADDRNVHIAAPDQGLQSRKNLLVSQVAGGAEKNEGIRTG